MTIIAGIKVRTPLDASFTITAFPKTKPIWYGTP